MQKSNTQEHMESFNTIVSKYTIIVSKYTMFSELCFTPKKQKH